MLYKESAVVARYEAVRNVVAQMESPSADEERLQLECLIDSEHRLDLLAL